jgi:ATP-binding cassette subfamily B protein
MEYLVSIKNSLGELWSATFGVLRDAWQMNKGQFMLLCSLAIILGFTPYLTSGIMALIINELVVASKTHAVSASLLTLVFVGAGAYFARDAIEVFVSYYRRITAMDRRQWYDMAFSEKLASLDVATHEDPSFKDEVQVLQEQGGAGEVSDFLNSLIRNIQSVIGVVTASVIVCAIDWRFFVIILIASAPQLYMELRYGRGLWNIFQSQSEDRRLYGELRYRTTHAHCIRELQSFQTVPYFIGRQREVLTRFNVAQKSEERRRFLFMLLSQGMLGGAMLIVLLLLIRQVAEGSLQIGTFSFVFGTTMSLEGTITNFFVNIADQRSSARAVAPYYAIMERQPFVKQSVAPRPFIVTKAPRIEFRNITFAYPMKPSENVLTNFSLTIEPGERIALVGVNGAGKSTLIKLLYRFYDPTEGIILINDVDLRDIDRGDWYRNLALLAQEFDTYEFTVGENIRLGRYTLAQDQAGVEHAAQRAGADTFINHFAERYNQQIGVEFAGGINLSGGQRQKLALARVLYRDAFVTVLDEPTAHVDAHSEQVIFEQLESQLGKEQSLILISHRFSTVRNAHRICVIENGRVAELGSHAELVSQQGIYAGLFAQQARGYL